MTPTIDQPWHHTAKAGDWHDREEDAAADQAAMLRACKRVILECDIRLEANRRAERIVRRTLADAHSFDRIEAARPIKQRLIHKLQVREGLAAVSLPIAAKEAA